MVKPTVSSFVILGLAFTGALSAATDAPEAAERQQMLDHVQQYAARYLESLPNFVCARVTEQYEAGKKPEKWRQRDTLTARLIFNQGRENQTLELVNGEPIAAGRFIDQPLTSEVEFGGLVTDVLDVNAHADISWSRWEDLQGKRLAVFQYVVNQQHSHITVGLGGVEIKVPYRGLIYASPDTGEIWRFTSELFDVPREVQTKSLATTIDYAPVEINNKRFILPSAATILLDTGRKNILNKVSFNDYRKFDAESKITFVSGSN